MQKAKDGLEQEKKDLEEKASKLNKEREKAVSLAKHHEQKGVEVSHTSQQELTKLKNELRQKAETIGQLNKSLVQAQSKSETIQRQFNKQTQGMNQHLQDTIDSREKQIKRLSDEKASMAQTLQTSRDTLQQTSLELKKAFNKSNEYLETINTRTHSLTKRLEHIQDVVGKHTQLVEYWKKSTQQNLSTLREEMHQETAKHSTTQREKEALELKLQEAQVQNHTLSEKRRELSEQANTLKEVESERERRL